jgi:hypothetical protein
MSTMPNSRTRLLAAAAIALSATASGAAAAAGYTIDWTGSGGYSMTGMFSFADGLLGTVITGADLDSLMISVFDGGGLIDDWDLFADGPEIPAAVFNFNFDSAAGTFNVGGLSGGPNGQQWNAGSGSSCTSVGFASGNAFQGVCVGGSFVGAVPVADATLTATPKTPVVPLPAAAPLLIGALGGLAILRRRRAATA